MSNTTRSGTSTNALTSCDPNTTYGSLLQIANNNTGVTASLQTIYDGVGNATALQLSSSAVNVTAFKINNVSVAIGGALTFSGAFSCTLTVTGTTALTLPTSGNLVTDTSTSTLTNKTLTAPVIATIINSGTLTLPTSTDTLVGRATTDTLTNKTLTAPKIDQINDTNGLAEIIFTPTGSAVNQLTISNAATATSPKISATGSDSNIDISLQTKGTGTYKLLGTSSQAAELKFYEDTDNGTNYVSLRAPASVGTDLAFTLPSADGTSDQVWTTNGSGVFTAGTMTGTAATQAQQETATSIVAAVTPGRQQYHPSSAKAWLIMSGTGTIAIRDSYNTTSITDNGTGDYTWTIATDFSSSAWSPTFAIEEAGVVIAAIKSGGLAAGTLRFLVTNTSGSGVDSPNIGIHGFGDQ